MERKIFIPDDLYKKLFIIVKKENTSVFKKIIELIEKEIKNHERKEYNINRIESEKLKDFLYLIFSHIIDRLTRINVFDLLKNTIEGKYQNKELYFFGMKYNKKKNLIYIVNNNPFFKKILVGKKWENFNFSEQLRRLEFAENKMLVQNFGPYNTHRAIELQADKFISYLENIFEEKHLTI